MVSSSKKQLEKILIETGAITKEALEKAQEEQCSKGGHLGEILIKGGFITQDDLLAVLSKTFNILPLNLSRINIDPKISQLIPEKAARHYRVIPISKVDEVLTVVISDPLNILAIEHVRQMTGCEVRAVITSDSDLNETLDKCYSDSGLVEDLLKDIRESDLEFKKEEDDVDTAQIMAETQEAPVIKLVNFIVIQAIKERASDIHLEAYENAVRVRYRIDGVLHEKHSFPKRMYPAIVSRIKIISELDIAERRLPQDGRFKIRIGERGVDFRVNVLPGSFGEKVTIRILDSSSLPRELQELGFDEDSLKKFQEGILHPYGIILVTGPTGSGKTTTLYSALRQINIPDRQIITVEDPVEYSLMGINQIHIRPEIGLTFPAALRAILRADPDVVMVGEIRDKETAEISVKAALSGHLTFSTLHTNDSVGAISRLIDMGIEPFLISSSLVMVVAQRLARKICGQCKEMFKVPQDALKDIGLKSEIPTDVLYRGRGCKACNNTGYRGRVAVVEVLNLNDEIKELIMKRADSNQIKKVAVASGMETLRDNALRKVLAGITTIEEVMRITADF